MAIIRSTVSCHLNVLINTYIIWKFWFNIFQNNWFPLESYIYFFLHFLKFYFIFKLYNIVLVLPNIEMNPPQESYIFYLEHFKTEFWEVGQGFHQTPGRSMAQKRWRGSGQAKPEHLLPEHSHLLFCGWASVSPLDHRWRLLGPVVAVNTGELELELYLNHWIALRCRWLEDLFPQNLFNNYQLADKDEYGSGPPLLKVQ